MDKEKVILKIFNRNNGYAETRDITDAGIHNYYLERLVEENKIIKIKHGLYRLSEINVEDEIEEVCRIVPGGVVCLFSAWNYYQLSDFVPPEYHIAIQKSRKIRLPDYPPIKLYYWSDKYWDIGITSVTIGNSAIPIYEKEKSVCDAIRFRNKVGSDMEKEVLKMYLRKTDRNIDQLLHFSRLLNVERRMKNHLNILL